MVMLARTEGQLERVRLYVKLWRELHVEYGLGFIDDPERPDKNGRTRVFEKAWRVGCYLAPYFTSEQFKSAAGAEDMRGRMLWVSPVLTRKSGFNMTTVAWLRVGWRLQNGNYKLWDPTALWTSRLPSWWHTDSSRAWVCAVLGWDGVPVENLDRGRFPETEAA